MFGIHLKGGGLFQIGDSLLFLPLQDQLECMRMHAFHLSAIAGLFIVHPRRVRLPFLS